MKLFVCYAAPLLLLLPLPRLVLLLLLLLMFVPYFAFPSPVSSPLSEGPSSWGLPLVSASKFDIRQQNPMVYRSAFYVSAAALDAQMASSEPQSQRMPL